MRLIRITTEDEDCRFDGRYDAEMNVNPGASIALQQLTLEQQDSLVNVTGSNNTITATRNAVDYTTTITPKLYNFQNHNELFTDITNKLNATAQYYPPAVGQPQNIQGVEWVVSLDNTFKTQISARKGKLGEMNSEWNKDADVDVLDNLSQNIWYLDNSVSLPNDTCKTMAINEYRMPRGNGFMEAIIETANYDAGKTGDTNAVWLCATSVDIRGLSAAQLTAFIDDPITRVTFCNVGVGIRIENATGGNGGQLITAFKIEDATTTDFFTSSNGVVNGALDNPHIRLQRSGNNVYASYYCERDGDTSTEKLTSQGSDDFTSRDLYQFVIYWHNEDYIVISQVQASLSAFSNVFSTQQLTHQQVDNYLFQPGEIPTEYIPPKGLNTLDSPYQPLYQATSNHFLFADESLASFLGFQNPRIPEAGSLIGINFVITADKKFTPRITANSLIVLSDTFVLDSFDNYDETNGNGQRRSILAVVPIDNSNDGKVMYESYNLNFINIKNLNKLMLRNLKFRLTDQYYQPIKLYGQASLVLLVKDAEE